MKINKYFTDLVISRPRVLPGLLAGLLHVFYISGAYAAITKPEDIQPLLCKVAGYMFDILIALSSIMVIYAAFMYITAGESSEKVSKAHKILAYAVVAIIVALLAKNLPVIVSNLVGGPTPTTCK